jgi:4-diphosphocytidyl-2-C-methyl-D-erythritol kinase
MPTAVRSHAKINLGLYIGAPRPDGFHSLVTVYQTLELHDVVTVSARPAAETALSITSNDSRVPTDSRNTAWKMADLALAELGVTAEVAIVIEKCLPVQGGLGAGSANAVAALVGLEAELGIDSRGLQHIDQNQPQTPGAPSIERSLLDGWETTTLAGIDLNRTTLWSARRLQIAAQVGSDVPLFLIGGTVLGVDRGQEVYPLPELEPLWCVVAAPAVGVSTPQAFRDWDTLCAAEGLTAEASQAKLNELSSAYASAFAEGTPQGRLGSGSSGDLSGNSAAGVLAGPLESALVRTGISSWIQNDFERVVFPQHPPLSEIKRLLAAPSTPEAALHASLSGSGSALFGLYQTRGDAEAALDRLGAAGIRSHMTRTLPRRAYWRQMLLQEVH